MLQALLESGILAIIRRYYPPGRDLIIISVSPIRMIWIMYLPGTEKPPIGMFH